MDDFARAMLKKINKGIELEEWELNNLARKCEYETTESEESIRTETIIKLDKKYFALIGRWKLIAHKPSCFYFQPREVKPIPMTINEWVFV